MKKENYQHYFDNAQEVLDNKHYNIEGFDDELSADGFADEAYGADGQEARSAAAQVSSPYIFTITNENTSAVTNVVVLLPSTQLLKCSTTTGNGAPATGVSVASGISNVTYAQFLWQLQAMPVTFGKILMYSSTAANLTSTLSINKYDANGYQTTFPLIPLVNLFQQSTTFIEINHNFTASVNTGITVSSIAASSTLTLYLYPTNKVNVAKSLTGIPAVAAYGKPAIGAPQVMQITGK